MKIAVCIKQVPTREWQPRLNDDKTWIRDQDVSYEMNEPDAYALEEALRLREKHGGEVVVCSAGPVRVQQMLREALARGADRALHVEDDSLASADALVTAGALAAAMANEGFDLVLTGLQSDDQGHGQTGVVLAERLGIPHSTIIIEIQVQGAGDGGAGIAPDGGPAQTAVRVKRELEGGWFQWVVMPMPALLTIQSGINQLRYATLKGIMAAKKTHELIPLCHPLLITKVSVDFVADEKTSSIAVSATVRVEGKTGVEMEALTACSIAALTLYDMCKAVDRGMKITDLRLTEKSGGKSGTFTAE
mgnify:CR=1 FL=1